MYNIFEKLKQYISLIKIHKKIHILFNRVIELALNGPNRIGTIDAVRVLGNFLIKDIYKLLSKYMKNTLILFNFRNQPINGA